MMTASFAGAGAGVCGVADVVLTLVAFGLLAPAARGVERL
jgi:hypothetical protein